MCMGCQCAWMPPRRLEKWNEEEEKRTETQTAVIVVTNPEDLGPEQLCCAHLGLFHTLLHRGQSRSPQQRPAWLFCAMSSPDVIMRHH